MRQSPEVHGACIISEERDNPIDLTDDVVFLILEDYGDEHMNTHHDLAYDQRADHQVIYVTPPYMGCQRTYGSLRRGSL